MCVSAGTDTRFSFSHGKDTTSVRGTYAPCALCALIGFTEEIHDQLHLPGRQTAVSGLVTRGLKGLLQLLVARYPARQAVGGDVYGGAREVEPGQLALGVGMEFHFKFLSF